MRWQWWRAWQAWREEAAVSRKPIRDDLWKRGWMSS
jgi:hypothetical protein